MKEEIKVAKLRESLEDLQRSEEQHERWLRMLKDKIAKKKLGLQEHSKRLVASKSPPSHTPGDNRESQAAHFATNDTRP